MAGLFKFIALVAFSVNLAALCTQATPVVGVSDKSLPGDGYSNPVEQTNGRHFLHARAPQQFVLKSDQTQKQASIMVNLAANSPTATTYKPTDGKWPGFDQPAIIKCLKKSAGYITERDNTKLVDSLKVYLQPQFIDSGEQLTADSKSTGTMCIVLQDLTASSPALSDLDSLAKSKGRGAACKAVYDKALPLAVFKVKELGAKGYVHGDLPTKDLFFSTDLTSVELIDWSGLKAGTELDVEMAKSGSDLLLNLFQFLFGIYTVLRTGFFLMARPSPPKDPIPLTALALDGSSNTLNALSELYILQDAAGRWAHDSGLGLRGEDVQPRDMFDIIGGTGIGGFYAVLFARLGLKIGQAIQAHRIFEERLFTSELWSRKQHENSINALNETLNEIFIELDTEVSLDSAFEDGIPSTKCVVCVLNVESAETCRLLRSYRPRGSHSPPCTVRQVLQATFADCDHLPPVRIQGEDFVSALNGYANPSRVLMKELSNTFPKRSMVACVVSIGAGYSGSQKLANTMDSKALARLLQSSEVVANEFASQCHELGTFFIRLSVSSQHSHTGALEQAYSQVKGVTMAYLDVQETIQKLDDLVDALMERSGVVSLERLGSLAGKDGQSELVARVQEVQRQLHDSIFRDINTWLQPIQQVSKLDSNIQARGETTCEWILQNATFIQWMEALGGLFWYHGLMGTGKTFTSSFIIQSLLRRDDIYVAYYYFEFTNPITLSEEALHRSLVSQLAAADPTMRDIHQKHNYGGHEPQLATLQAALTDLISASTKPIYIIIDALDELPLGQRKYFLRTLSTFCSSTAAPRTHVMLTSREDRDICKAFDGRADFQLNVQVDLVRQDIAAYIDQQLALEKWSSWPQDEIELMRRVLNERADGQFRMVACQIDILSQAGTSDMLLKSLHSLPRTLSSTYEYILNQIHEHHRGCARILFAILSFAPYNISVPELNALVAIDFGDENDPDHLPVFQNSNHFHDPLDLLDLGTSFVSQTTGSKDVVYLRLAHASVKEYLLADSGEWFALQEGPAHNLIASACLAVLLHFQVLTQIDDDTPFEYSLRYWFNHIFPNGPSQLLAQQKALYTTHPWKNQSIYHQGYRREPLLSSVASLCLLDFLETCLTACVWNGDDLESALIAAAGSRRSRVLALQGCRLLLPHCRYGNYRKVIGKTLEAASQAGNIEVVQFIVDNGADINATGGAYGTALQAAAEGRSLEVVELLVEKGADVNARGDYGTALQSAARWGSLKMVQYLVEKGADVNAMGEHYGSSLHAAAWCGSLEIVQFLVEKVTDVNAAEKFYGTPLGHAACSGSLETAQFLLTKGVDINARGEYGTALLCALVFGKLKVVQSLVEKGADVNALGRDHRSPLQAAVRFGDLKFVRLLVEKGADVNPVRGEDGTPLQAAACSKSLEVVQFLVEKGAAINAVDLQAAACCKRLAIAQFLVEKGADVNAVGGQYGTSLQAAAWGGSLEVVQFLVEKGTNVNAVGGEYGTPLQAAACSRSLEVVQFLVEEGADINAMGGLHGTALQGAVVYGVAYGELKVVQFLVEMGADVNAVGGRYGTSLQVAAGLGSLELVDLLVEKGADVNTAVGEYGTPLQAAACSGSLEVVQFLVEKGADVSAVGGLYGTALQGAVVYGNLQVAQFIGADVNAVGGQHGMALQAAAVYGKLEVAQFLVENGADVNAKGETYGTSLQAAACSGSIEVTQFLVENGADVHTVGGLYGTALQGAIVYKNLMVAQFLMEKGADVNIVEGQHGTALQAAAVYGHLEVVQFLVEKGADVNAIGGEYWTALHAAANYGNLVVAQFLVENGAKVDIVNEADETALHLATRLGRLEIVHFLEDSGTALNANGMDRRPLDGHSILTWVLGLFMYLVLESFINIW
ncbi:ankyrin repeat-containing domain protein [Flagelloscypha sp. PMI_526]|nr:ankyrin repeat-containing domain protein [Flagelloscypha sp. PMI_526]